MYLTLYHASNVKINEFDPVFLNTGTANQQLGTGFYFADKPQDLSFYGKYLHECRVRIGKSLSKEEKHRLNYSQVKKIIQSAPNHKETLENFGDIYSEGYLKVLNDTIRLYLNLNDGSFLHMYNCFSNDFYNDNEYQLNKVIYNLLGINCIYDKRAEVTVYNVFLSNQIKVINIIQF